MYRRKGSMEHGLGSLGSPNIFSDIAEDTPLAPNISVHINLSAVCKRSVSASQPRRTLNSEGNLMLQMFQGFSHGAHDVIAPYCWVLMTQYNLAYLRTAAAVVLG